ncbi:transposase [Mariniblastus fucicola]|uniref:Transposase IS200 like protein n=1 Tax=Mariniblastus fucicola TaxID=980251 RepID=A0A5B9PDI4_9BACT|nr:transposase [Mariniblastus fucicola]QEG23170.1 Transposase IS200 like protein [Mariniblastus fucicola]
MSTISQPLKFQPFDDKGPVRIYRNGFLPHLRQAGCTYFVTFRLDDSVPEKVLRQWRSERFGWLKARSIEIGEPGFNEKFDALSEQDKASFERAYAIRLFEELDKCHGSNCLSMSEVAKVVAESLEFFHGSRLEIGDYVVMSNHVHALITPLASFDLENVLHSIKSFSANKINKRLSKTGALWMSESYDRLVRDESELLRTQEYIRANPSKAGLQVEECPMRTVQYSIYSELQCE